MLRNILLVLLSCSMLNGMSQRLSVVTLKCESKINPLGIENANPILSWQLLSSERGISQTSYRILVSDNPTLIQKNIGNTWDSKQVSSSNSINIEYKGKPLVAVKDYYWKVRVWDNKKHVSTWSVVAHWQMGLPNEKDWKGAQWIAYESLPGSKVNILPSDREKDTNTGSNILPLLRKSIKVEKPIKKASLFICGLGQFELNINGKKVGDHFLDPGWTKYDKQALYVPFDVTKQIQNGENVIGVLLGNGFYYIPPVPGRYRKLKVAFGYPKMKVRLAIEYSDGSVQNVVSDASWRTAPGPITFSGIYGGENYDARLEQKGWDEPSFNDVNWKAVLVVDGPAVLNSQVIEPLKVMEQFSPIKKTVISSGKWMFDLGQNASGIPWIQVQGKKGDIVRITPAELLKSDGTANQHATGSPYYLQYILKGDGVETWSPRFTYYGFRYLQIDGAVPGGENNPKRLPVILQVKGLHTRNAAERIGSFACSNDLFNKTYSLIDWAIRSNMVSLFTDCPHREKLGWLEEAHLMGNSVRYNYDVQNLFRKEIEDVKNSQTPEGLIPEIAPEYVNFSWGNGMFRDSPEWGSTGIIVPWYLYQWYGDKRVLEGAFPMMKRYVSYLQSKAKGNILYQGLGDWYDLGPKAPGVSQLTPMGVTGTAIYYYDLTILSQIANLLGRSQEAIEYKNLGSKVRQAFNDSFFHKETMQYASGSQAANAMAVYMKLVDPQYKDAVVENIVKDIRNHNNSLTAGDIGYRYLLCVLLDEGRSDVIFDMNSRSDVPGYGFQLAKGATALTEAWQALSTSSNNHFMLGHLMEWFYRGLGGIDQQENSIGYKQIVINPQVVGDVTFANATYESMYGKIISNWKKDDNSFHLQVQVPVNTTAIVYLPAKAASEISESNKQISSDPAIQVLGSEKGKLKLKLSSGVYSFDVKHGK
jgi:alpha-L-rhamnosidase